MTRSGVGPPASAGGLDARAVWQGIEPLHAVTYFAPECRQAAKAAGLPSFWMGYFAARAAPLGPVGPAAVAALFFNFHPGMVARSIPDAWSLVGPADVLEMRRAAAAKSLTLRLPSVEELAATVDPLLDRVVAGADGSGRALFSANRELDRPADPVEALWQSCTSLREHRGDGHVAMLASRGLDGCEALALFAASEGSRPRGPPSEPGMVGGRLGVGIRSVAGPGSARRPGDHAGRKRTAPDDRGRHRPLGRPSLPGPRSGGSPAPHRPAGFGRRGAAGLRRHPVPESDRAAGADDSYWPIGVTVTERHP